MQLTTDPKVQPLVSQFVALDLDAGSPEFETWTRLFRPKGDGLPIVYIVGPDGKELYNKVGAPLGVDLYDLLSKGIEATGGLKELPTPESLARDKKVLGAVRRAKQSLAQKEPGMAVAAIIPFLEKADEKKAENPLTKVAAEFSLPIKPAKKLEGLKQLDEFVEKLETEAKAELLAAVEKLGTDEALNGAIALARAQRVYSKLPSMADSIKETLAKVEELAATKELLDQARLLDEGQENEDNKKRTGALAAYRKVLEAFPKSAAADIAEKRIDHLTGGKGSKTPAQLWTDTTGKFKIEASLIAHDEDSVTLKKTDGTTIVVPLTKLSEASKKQLSKEKN